ncbi:MAG: DegV family protein [Clostridiales bacterium]|nr:DegV family protein [Clostridiales bacterium]
MRVKITSDSTCDLSPELIDRFHIGILPMVITFGDTPHRDGVDITPEDIYRFVAESGTLPKTCAMNTAEYSDFFRRNTADGSALVHFCIGSGFSSTCQNARIAAEDTENVFVVDSENLSAGQGLLVLRAAEMAKEGMGAREIAEACQLLASKVEASFVLDDLTYLVKGGRCSGAAAFGANVLKLKPCIEVRHGIMTPAKKYRGRMCSVILEYVTDKLRARKDLDTRRIFITHTRCEPEWVEAAKQRVTELAPDFTEVLETTAGATVTTHCGPSTLGVLFIRK